MAIYEGKAKESVGQPLATLTYTYDQAGNKLTSTEERGGKKEETRFTYDANNRLTKLVTPTDTISYTYDKNGNRTSSGAGDAKLDYIYDTENRLLAVKDKEGLLFAALYDGEDNRVFTASRTEATNTYQLFKRQAKAKSPNTSPNGQAHSLFWYGFTQNVLQFFSGLASTQGYDWIGTFDTVSTAYHQKVAKDQATKDGLVVNPPSLGNLPGEGEVTYASQVQDVLIPYTTRTDTYNYYETRNYVNDINQEHTQVLQTYDDQLQKRETYTYGNGRASYTDEVKGASYNYLTNVSGSTVGLTQDGQAVASSSYELYGSFKSTTDRTGNSFHYNGEARDVTGFDYLRARYYDSQAGTFLTEDSYPGQQTDPLSQNGYSYVENNPVNYTDPSGHRIHAMMDGGRGKRKSNPSKVYPIFPSGTNIVQQQQTIADPRAARGLVGAQTSFISQTQGYSYNPLPDVLRDPLKPSGSPVPYGMTPFQAVTQAYLQAVLPPPPSAYQQAVASGQSTYNWGQSKSREAGNIDKNWTKALEEIVRHFCETAKKADGKGKSRINQKRLDEVYQNSQYGGQQDGPMNSVGDEREKIVAIIRTYYPGMSEREVQEFLSRLNSEGCGYVALVNTFMANYKGTEAEFEKTFGFPLYTYKNGKRYLNYNYLLTDFYASQDNYNADWLGGRQYNPQEDIDATTGYGTTMASRKYRFQQYLKGRKIDVDIDTGFLGTGISATSGNYHKYSAQGYVIVTVSPIILRSPTTQKIAHKFDGGHAMTVTGVDDSGNFIVSSWGDKYILNPDDYKFYHTLKFEVVNY